MTEPVITCPHCRGEIKLTETLAAPLLEMERRKLEQVRRDNEAAVAERESGEGGGGRGPGNLAAAQRATADLETQLHGEAEDRARGDRARGGKEGDGGGVGPAASGAG